MKNIIKLSIAVLAAVLAASSCAQVEFPDKSSDCSIQKIYLSVPVPTSDPEAEVEYKTVDGVIDEANGKVTFPVPYYMSETEDIVTEVSKVFIVASLPVSAVITPGVGGLQDMTQPKDITVTAADGTTKNYTLEAVLTKSSAKAITSFKVTIKNMELTGIILEDECAINLLVAEQLRDTVKAYPAIPEIEVSPRAELVTKLDTPFDFSQDVVFTVRAADGSTQDWTVRLTEPAKKDYGFGFYSKVWTYGCSHFYNMSNDQRSMCVTKNFIVIQDRYLAHMLFDKETGEFVEQIKSPNSSLQCMYVNKDSEGNMVSMTAPVWTSGVITVYYYPDGEQAEAVKIAEVSGLPDCGRKFSVAGSLKSGEAYIYTPKAKGAEYYRLHFTDGVYVDYKTITVDPKDGRANYTYLPNVLALGNTANSEVIIIDQASNAGEKAGYVNHYKADGTYIDGMADGARCGNDGVTADGKIFTFNGARYLMYIVAYGSGTTASMRIMDITDISNLPMAPTNEKFSSFVVFQSDQIYSTSNGNGTMAVDYDIAADGETAYVYIMLTAGDVMKYELTKLDM